MIYNELTQRGTEDFPMEYYYVDKNHTRYSMSAHWHTELEIIRILEGTLKIKLNDQTYLASPGDIIFVNSGTVHGAFPEHCIYECLVFHLDIFHTDNYGCKYFFDSLLNHEYVIDEFHSSNASPLHASISSIFDSFRHKSSGYKLSVIGALYSLFGTIIDNHLYRTIGTSSFSADKNVPKLKKVLSFISENYTSQISLKDMAESADMSSKYFCYFFKEMTGKTPIEYLNGYRIEKACNKLLHTDLSVTEIAFTSGFNDLSYFIKTFKAQKKTTPNKYRKSSLVQ